MEAEPIFKDWINRFDLLGWATLIDAKNTNRPVIPDFRGTNEDGIAINNKQGKSFDVIKATVVFTELTELGKQENLIIGKAYPNKKLVFINSKKSKNRDAQRDYINEHLNDKLKLKVENTQERIKTGKKLYASSLESINDLLEIHKINQEIAYRGTEMESYKSDNYIKIHGIEIY